MKVIRNFPITDFNRQARQGRRDRSMPQDECSGIAEFKREMRRRQWRMIGRIVIAGLSCLGIGLVIGGSVALIVIGFETLLTEIQL